MPEATFGVIPGDLLAYLADLFGQFPEAYLLEDIVPALREGRPIRIDETRTTKVSLMMAAEVVGVENRTMRQWLDAGRLPFTGTGDTRMLQLADVLAFKRQLTEARHEAVGDLAALTAAIVGD